MTGPLDAQIAESLGLSMETLASAQEAKQDDETRGFTELLRSVVAPRLVAAGWVCRYEGADGLGCFDHAHKGIRLIHSLSRETDGEVWSHCSFSRRDRVMPTWEQTRDLYWLVHPDQPGVIVVAPRSNHVNIAEVAHVWCCLTRPSVPDFTGGLGTI